MGISNDTYFIVTPGSEFVSKAYANLNGTDLFFYVNETSSLRVVNMTSSGGTSTPGSISYALAQNTKWVDVVQQTGVVHVYYEDLNGTIHYFPYTSFGGPVAAPVPLNSLVNGITFSAIFTPQSTPPAFMMMVDDGVRHNLYVSTDPMFVSLLTPSAVTYTNAINPLVYLSRPTIAMHPSDTNRITVTFQQTVVLTSVTGVGFYEIRVKGIV